MHAEKNEKDICIRNEKEWKETKGLKNDNCLKQLKKKKKIIKSQSVSQSERVTPAKRKRTRVML